MKSHVNDLDDIFFIAASKEMMQMLFSSDIRFKTGTVMWWGNSMLMSLVVRCLVSLVYLDVVTTTRYYSFLPLRACFFSITGIVHR